MINTPIAFKYEDKGCLFLCVVVLKKFADVYCQLGVLVVGRLFAEAGDGVECALLPVRPLLDQLLRVAVAVQPVHDLLGEQVVEQRRLDTLVQIQQLDSSIHSFIHSNRHNIRFHVNR